MKVWHEVFLHLAHVSGSWALGLTVGTAFRRKPIDVTSSGVAVEMSIGQCFDALDVHSGLTQLVLALLATCYAGATAVIEGTAISIGMHGLRAALRTAA